MKPRTFLLALLVLAGAALCARLGFWQISRWRQKQEWNRALRAAENAPPWKVDLLPAEYAGVRGRCLEVTGRYDESRQVLIGGRTSKETPGVDVITPLMTAGGVVLVDRGWIPIAGRDVVDLGAFREPGVRTVVGVPEPLAARPGPPLVVRVDPSGTTLWARRLDLDSLAARLGHPLLPYLIRQRPGPGVPARPARSLPTPGDEGTHLGYAIQWFAFAFILLAGSGWPVISRIRRTPP